VTHPHDLWLRRFRPRPQALLRLLCFPHAGGSAAFFRGWASLLPPTVELVVVQYPGRADRFSEPLVHDLRRLADLVAEAVDRRVPAPAAFFGHSLGAALALEVARRWERRRGPLAHLFASGRPAPHRPGTEHLDDDDTLWKNMVALGGTAEEFADRPELRDLALPVVRNDYRMSETFVPAPDPVLDCPITVYFGTDDPETASSDGQGWAPYTRGSCTLATFPGGHFYLEPRRQELVADMLSRLSASGVPALWPAGP
jgi:pyochelin biosynthetic protein PchC